MVTCGPIFALSLLVVSLGAFFVGIADRPPFVATTAPDLVVIVALSDDKDIGGNIMRLLEGTIKGIRATTALTQSNNIGGGNVDNNNNKRALMSAASRYGSPLGSEYLSVGLFLDDPRAVLNPRWAIGYAVDVSHEQAKAVASEIGTIDGMNVVRAVRVSLSSTLSARVPWRSVFTPMIAPRLHWPRGMDLYKAEGRTATCGRHRRSGDDDSDGGCAIAMEAYVTGPKGSRAWIDYTIVMGDTTITYDDLYPEQPGTTDLNMNQQQQGTQQEVQEPVVDAAESVPPQEVVADSSIEAPREDSQEVQPEAAAEEKQANPEALDEGKPIEDQVPPVLLESEAEAEQDAREVSEAGTHASEDAEIVPEEHEENDAPGEGGNEAADSSTFGTQHHEEIHESEGEGDILEDPHVEGGDESEHGSGDGGDEYGDEEEEVVGEDEEEEEEEGGTEHDEDEYDEDGVRDEVEEEIFEQDEDEEFNDEEDEVEHFEDEDRHDEF